MRVTHESVPARSTNCLPSSPRKRISAPGEIRPTVPGFFSASSEFAKVTALDQDKQVVAREASTSTPGAFYLTPLLPGHYTIRVEATGFKAFESKDLTLDQNQVMNLGVISLLSTRF